VCSFFYTINEKASFRFQIYVRSAAIIVAAKHNMQHTHNNSQTL